MKKKKKRWRKQTDAALHYIPFRRRRSELGKKKKSMRGKKESTAPIVFKLSLILLCRPPGEKGEKEKTLEHASKKREKK